MMDQTNTVAQGVLIALQSRKYRGMHAIVDEVDARLVAAYRWHPRHDNNNVYAQASPTGSPLVQMHRLILGVVGVDNFVDHINHNGLDNRRCNLRIASRSQNLQNSRPHRHGSSKYKGVSRYREIWKAAIRVNQRTLWIGQFENEIDAACAYDVAAREHFGEYAYLNFPSESEAS